MFKRRFALAAIGVLALGVANLGAASIPRQAPDFSITLSNGQQIRLAQYKGKVVALVFILTTCPHCQKAVQYLSQMQTEFGPRGLQVVASAIEDMAQIHLPDFLRQFNPPFPVGYDKLRPALDFMQHPPMTSPMMPLIAFCDREGMIRAQYEGYEPFFAEDQMEKNIRGKILELLGPGGAPGKKRTVRSTPK